MAKIVSCERIMRIQKMVILFGLIFAVGSCVPVPDQASIELPPPYVANLSYSAPSPPPQQGPVVVTVGKVAFKHEGTPWLTKPQFANLEKALIEDLTEILVAKGLQVRESFGSYDLIPYGEKKTIDFYLVPVVTALINRPDPLYVSALGTAKAGIVVKMDIKLHEIITRELMWSKSLNFVDTEASLYSLIQGYESEYGKVTRLMFRYNSTEDLMAKNLEGAYPAVMDTLFKLIDMEEMTVIKKQAQELKSEKGY